MTKRHSLNFVKNIIKDKNGTLISKKYINNKDLLDIRCNKCNYEWKIRFNDIQSGYWCPNCPGHVKYTYDRVRKIISEKNGKLLSDEYVNNKTDLLIKCNICDHEWQASLNTILANHWCPNCYKKSAYYSYKEVEDIVKRRRGRLISTEYINSWMPICIQCNICSNKWKVVFNSIQQDSWCPECSGMKTQKKITNIIRLLFPNNDVMSDVRFDWLVNPKTNKKLEIDIWVPYTKLAIEYDGEHHFVPVRYGGTTTAKAKENLKQQKIRDNIKNKLIFEHSEDIKYFIRFDYKENLTQEYIINKLKNSGVSI